MYGLTLAITDVDKPLNTKYEQQFPSHKPFRNNCCTEAKVVPENRYPLEHVETVEASIEGFFAVSPSGTRKYYLNRASDTS